jgi:ribonuclease VapC
MNRSGRKSAIKKIVFDSYALLKYLQQESGFERVKMLLYQAEKGALQAFLNQINLGEIYYCTIRRKGIKAADSFLNIFSQLPISLVSADEMMLSAAKIKAQHAISYADCFCAATAVKKKATIITGDPEFGKIEAIVNIQWI